VPRPGPGEVLIRVAAAAVNNTDINTRVGWYSQQAAAATAEASRDPATAADGSWTGSAMSFPRIQGADVCGRIVAVGAGVDRSRIGRRVIVQSCLRSRRGPSGVPWLGSEYDGGFAQYVTAPAPDTWDVASDLDDAALASLPCAYSTAENLLGRASVAAGERVLVTGASGGVGSAAIQLARRRGARVVAVAGAGKEAELAALGAETVVARGTSLLDALGRDSIDVVIDLVGGPQWPVLPDLLKPGGRYAVSGAIAGPLVELDLRKLYLKDLTLFGCTTQDDGVFADLVGYVERGEIRPLVARTYPLAAIVEAQQDFLDKRHVGKLVLLPP
jgi:NADPH:quinone reductase-like Zn-dependent oxidoreductase